VPAQVPYYVVTAYGVRRDSAATGARLGHVVNSVVPVSGGNAYVPAGVYRIDQNVAIPASLSIELENGARFAIDPSDTLTINGPLTAPAARIFTGRGTVVLGRRSVTRVLPEWWGAIGDSSVADPTANAAAFRSALTAVNQTGAMLWLSGHYKIQGKIQIPAVRDGLPITIRGSGRQEIAENGIAGATIQFTHSNDHGFDFSAPGTEQGIDISFVRMMWPANPNALFRVRNVSGGRIAHAHLEGTGKNGTGVVIDDGQQWQFQDVTVNGFAVGIDLPQAAHGSVLGPGLFVWNNATGVRLGSTAPSRGIMVLASVIQTNNVNVDLIDGTDIQFEGIYHEANGDSYLDYRIGNIAGKKPVNIAIIGGTFLGEGAPGADAAHAIEIHRVDGFSVERGRWFGYANGFIRNLGTDASRIRLVENHYGGTGGDQLIDVFTGVTFMQQGGATTLPGGVAGRQWLFQDGSIPARITYDNGSVRWITGQDTGPDVWFVRRSGAGVTPFETVYDGANDYARLGGLEVWRSVNTPPTLATGTNNDYPPGNFSTLRLAGTGSASTITGISGGQEGRRLRLINISPINVILAHQSVSSNVANRIISATGADVALAHNDVATLEYDNTSRRWRIVATER
jgi:hypothetical protein